MPPAVVINLVCEVVPGFNSADGAGSGEMIDVFKIISLSRYDFQTKGC